MNLEQRSLCEQIRYIVKLKNLNFKDLALEVNEHLGTKYTSSSLSRKLNNNRTINLDDLKTLADILGFKVKFELID